MKRKKTVCFVAGKSGGHIIPALTLAQKLVEKDKNTHILFFSTDSPIDKKILQNNKIVHRHVALVLQNVPYKKLLRFPIFLAHMLYATIKSFFIFLKNRPEKVISMGGYVSFPICISAFLLRIPIELFELNAVPGKAVTYLAPIAIKIHTCFEAATAQLPTKKCQIAEYPIRYPKDKAIIDKQSAYKTHGLLPNKYTILVLGGSQGSVSINNIIKSLITTSRYIAEQIQMIHQTGTNDTTDWNTFYKENNIHALSFTFKNDIQHYYHLADLVICRSGAGTLFETMFFNKTCITIPLETATTSHQTDNARALAKTHSQLVTMIQEKDLKINPSLLKNKIYQQIELLSKHYNAQ